MSFWRIFLLFVASLGMAACNDEGMKYVSGPDDPSLKATSRDIQEVRQFLEEQKQRDIAKGIREPGPTRPSVASGSLPPDHPSVGSDGGASGVGSVINGFVNLQVLEGRLPDGWKAGPPSSSMRIADISIPPAAGDAEGGTIAVFPEIGGGMQANIQRWYKQITQPDGRDTESLARVETLTAESGLEVTLVDVTGTFDGSTMMAKMEPQENWRLLGAIVKAPTGLVFLKGTGPEATMSAQREAMVGFLRTLRLPGAQADTSDSSVAPQRVETHGEIPTSSSQVPETAQAISGSRSIDLVVVRGELPDGWIGREPSSSMRVAEITLPASDGAQGDGELVAFYFGPGQGGSVEDNISRWVGQMQGGGEPQRESFYAGGMPITVVDVSGTFSATSMRPGAPASPPKQDQRLLGAIVESPRGSLFLKATGPEATMGSHRERFIGFLNSFQPQL